MDPSIFHNPEVYAVMFDSASEGIVAVDSEGKIGSVNSAAERLFGYTRGELIGKNIDKLLPASMRGGHKSHRETYMSKPEPRPMGLGRHLLALHKDGSEFPVEISLSPVEVEGELFVMAFVTEISRRLRSEKELMEARDRSQRYLDIAGVILLGLDREGRIELVNRRGCAVLGYREEDLIGQNWFDRCVPAARRAEIQSVFNKIVSGEAEGLERYQNEVIDAAGRLHMIEWRNSVLYDEQQNVIGTLSSGEDITEKLRNEEERRIHEQKLIQADKMASLGVLVSGVAHEINNPASFILLNGKILSRVWTDALPILNKQYDQVGDFRLGGMPYSESGEKIERLIHGVYEGARRIEKIVQSLKDFAREDPGKLDQIVSINHVVESALVIVNNLVKKSTNRFTVTYGTKIPDFRGNGQQMEQVVINLVTNACQALPDPEHGLTVSTAHDKKTDAVTLDVIDEGVGIPEESMPRIFDPFFTTKQSRGGTGLGLSICYNIVQTHGGTLRIDSTLGKGTSVRISLPLAQT